MSKSIYLKGESGGKSIYLQDCCNVSTNQDDLLTFIQSVQSTNPSSSSTIGSNTSSQQSSTIVDLLTDTITTRLLSVTEQFTFGGGLFSMTTAVQGTNQIVTQLSAIGQSSLQITTDSSTSAGQDNYVRIGDSNVFITGPNLIVKSESVKFYDPILTHGYYDIINDPTPTNTLAYGLDFPYIPTSGGSIKTGFIGYIRKNNSSTTKNRFVMYNDATVTSTEVSRASVTQNEIELDVIYTSTIRSPDDTSISNKDILISSTDDISMTSVNTTALTCAQYSLTASNTINLASASTTTIDSSGILTLSSNIANIDICGNNNINLYSYTTSGSNTNAYIKMIGNVVYGFSNGSIYVRAGNITVPSISGLTETSDDLYLGATNKIFLDSANIYLYSLANSPNPLKINSSNMIVASAIDLNSSEITGTLQISHGGTSATSFNTNGVVISGTTSTSALTSLSLTANGKFVIGTTSAPLVGGITSTSTNLIVGYSSPNITISTNTDVSFNSISIKGTNTGYAIIDWNSLSASNVSYNIPDVTTGDFVMTTGSQIITGAKEFSGNVKLSALTASRPLKLDSSNIVTASQIVLSSANDVTSTLQIGNGGTNATSFNTHGVVISGTTSTSALTALSLTTNGNLIIGATGNAPLVGSITSTTSNLIVGYSIPNITLATSTDVSFNSISVKGNGTGYAVIDWNSSSISNISYNIPDVATGEFVMTTGNQILSGLKTIQNNLVFDSSSDRNIYMSDISSNTPNILSLLGSNNTSPLINSGGGDVHIYGGNASGGLTGNNGGVVKIQGGASGSLAGFGYINIYGGYGNGNGGDIDINAGDLTGTGVNGVVNINRLNITGTLGLTSLTLTNLTVTSSTNLSGTVTLSSLSGAGNLKVDASKNIIIGGIDLSSADVSGILQVVNGGTGVANFSANSVVISGTTTTSPLSSLTLTDGQIIIGSTGNPPNIGNITTDASSNIVIGYTSPNITINTKSTVSFDTVSVKGLTNYAVMTWSGTGGADVSYNIPDVISSDFVMTQGMQTLYGKTFGDILNGNNGISIIGGNIDLGTDAADDPINIGTSASTGRNIIIGNTLGTTSTTIKSGTGNINLGTNADNNIINIGSDSSGARIINIGTSASSNVVNIGSTSASANINYGNSNKSLNMGPEQIVTFATTTITNVSGGTTNLITYTLATGEVMSGTIYFQIKISDGTDYQNGEGSFVFTSVVKTGTATVSTSAPIGTTARTVGTLSFTATSSVVTNTVTIGINVTSSLVATIKTIKFTLVSENNDGVVILHA